MATVGIDGWINGLPNDVEGIKVRVGSRRSLPNIAIVALPGFSQEAEDRLKDISPIRINDRTDFLEIIEEEAAAAGFPHEHEVLRLHAVDGSGRIKRSFQQTGTKRGQLSGNDLVISQLVDGILKSNAELRKSVDILTGSLAHREDVLKDSIEAMVSAQQMAVESEATSLLNMIEGAIPSESENDPLKEQAAGILSQIGSIFTGGSQVPLNADTVADMMEADPSIVNDLVNNERVKSAFMGAMANNGASGSNE